MHLQTYDWIVIGGGITGSTLSYELVKKGLKVLLLEKESNFKNATYYSYGGVGDYFATTDLSKKISRESIKIYHDLSEELEGNTEFREIDLTLTIDANDNPQKIAENYQDFAIIPQLLSVKEACKLEPLLNPKAISGILKLPYYHINPHKTNIAYQEAFRRLGGEISIQEVTDFLKVGNTIKGVKTKLNTYHAANTVVSTGGLTRRLLQQTGIKMPIYFSYAQFLVTPPVDIKLSTMVMPAYQKRFEIQAEYSKPVNDSLWDIEKENLLGKILDSGAIQFLDGHFCIGQISELMTSPDVKINSYISESELRKGIFHVLPSLGEIPGTWHYCLVAFARDLFPTLGQIHNFIGIHLFSGFTATLTFAPSLARHFANFAVGEDDDFTFLFTSHHGL